ncbi:MAG: biopolymer transporter ExbD [Bacteroidales bacterium]|nr:biopolymer transporter ExbD [Bacteroidales bacterium]
MSKFTRKGKVKGVPPISTSSLPDIVFMLLFFFMVSTTLKETSINVKYTLPEATETVKLEKKSLVSYIYVGAPKLQYQALFGTGSRIQLDDSFKSVNDIGDYIASEREKRDEKERPKMTVSLKADDKTKMGLIQEIKIELRKASALKLNYSSRKRVTDSRYQ